MATGRGPGGDHRSARPPCGRAAAGEEGPGVRDVSSLRFHLLLPPLPCSGPAAAMLDAPTPRVAYRRPCSSRTRRALPQPR